MKKVFLVLTIFSQLSYAVTSRECQFMMHNFDSETYHRLCDHDSNGVMTEKEFASLTHEQQTDMVLWAQENEDKEAKEVVAEARPEPVHVTINNNLPESPTPIVQESSSSFPWFLVGILAGGAAGAAGIYYGTRK